jgi:hypothetical protein
MADRRAKEIKAIVEAMLAQEEVAYEDWLYQKHLEYLAEHSSIVLTALRNAEKQDRGSSYE